MLCTPRGFCRRLLVLAGLCLVQISLTSEAFAVEAVVTLKDGQEMRGELVSQDNASVKLSIDGELKTIKIDDVKQVKTLDSVEAQYMDRKARLKADDLQGRYDLAYWLFEQKAYPLAMNELVDLRRRFPDDQKTQLLIKVIQQRMKLQAGEDGDGQTQTTENDGQSDGVNEMQPVKPGEIPRLTKKQINAIKVWELPTNFVEEKVLIIIPNAVMTEVLTKYADNPAVPKGLAAQQKLLREPGYKKLDMLFALRAREYYEEVVVRQEPPALLTFRQQLNPQYVLPYFRRYFGEGQIPGFALLNGRSEADVYTNFFILQDFFYDDRPMINRLEPDKSLLLQWGLDRSLADFPAPEIPGWQPRFRSKDDPNYKRYLNWISSLTNNADYGIPRIVPANSAPKKAEPAAKTADDDASS